MKVTPAMLEYAAGRLSWCRWAAVQVVGRGACARYAQQINDCVRRWRDQEGL